MPERIRGSVRPQRVGKHISKASSMKHGIAPEGQGSTRVGEQAAGGRGDETKSALSNTVLLRRVWKGEPVLDAKFCMVAGTLPTASGPLRPCNGLSWHLLC